MNDIDNKNNKHQIRHKKNGKLKKNSVPKFKKTIKPIKSEPKQKLTKKKVPKKSKNLQAKRTMVLKKSTLKKLEKDNSDNKKENNKFVKKIKLDSSNILSTIMGELLINTLVDKSNKVMKKKYKKTDNDYDSSYSSEEDSDYSPEESDLEDFPSDIDYTEDEQSYIKKLNKDEKNELALREFLLNESKKKEVPIRFKILRMDSLSMANKSNIIDKLDNFYELDPVDNEYHKLSTWVNWLEKIPFGVSKSLPVSNKNTPLEVGNFLKKARNTLDKAVFGHIEAKEKILTILSKQISNPVGEGTCIAIQGPPGNGKTTLVKEGICKALDRPFAFIPLGGMQDSSFLMGHEYTYEGAKPGRIIEILSESGCMNPVIYFDELDKISQSPKGDEIANMLCHLTDTSQNSEFHDKYMSGIDFDLSKAIFIFSYNNVQNINPILLDRLYKIKTDGFDVKSKKTIAQDYLIPKMLKDYNISKEDIIFKDETLQNLIDHYTDKEKGVRNLKRCLETVISKVNILQYLVAAEDNLDKHLGTNYKNIIDEKAKEHKTKKKKGKKRKKEDSDDIKVGIKLKIKDKKKVKKSKLKKKVPKATMNTYYEYGRDVLDLSGSELEDFVDRNIEDNKKEKEKVRKHKVIKEFKKKREKITTIKQKSEKVKLEDVKVKDVVNFKLKSFRFPLIVDDSVVKAFIKKDDRNPSIEHLYL